MVTPHDRIRLRARRRPARRTPVHLGCGSARVTLARRRGGLVALVCGELDVAAGPGLTALLRVLERSPRPVLVDLAAVTFADSSGVEPLLQALARRRRDADRGIALCGVPRPVARVLDLLAEVETVGTVDTASWRRVPRNSGGPATDALAG